MDDDQSLTFHNWTFVNTNRETLSCFVYCIFNGVRCDNEGNVVVLDLYDKGLSGTLPDVIAELSTLRQLNLTNNSIAGSLPNKLLQMSHLAVLDLGNNFFTGPFPDLSQLFSLRQTFLQRNLFRGTLPATLCTLTDLEAFDISYMTNMWGTLPDCMSDLTALTTLEVTSAGFGGTIPAELCTTRIMNGLFPNTFACDGVACAVGTYSLNNGRRVGNETCEECKVPSNVLGSQSCQWFDTLESPEEFTSDIPSSQPLYSTSPTIAASSHTRNDSYSPSQAPEASVISEATLTPSTFPSLAQQLVFDFVSSSPSTNPTVASSTVPTLFPSANPQQLHFTPTRSNDAITEKSEHSLGKSERAGFILAATLLFAAVILMTAFVRSTKRDKFTPHQSSIGQGKEEASCSDSVAKDTGFVDIIESKEDQPMAKVMEVQRGQQVSSILKTAREPFNLIRVEDPRESNFGEATKRVRFDIPTISPSSSSTCEANLKNVARSTIAVERIPENRTWMSWINPIIDPINACSVPCQGFAVGDAADVASVGSGDSTLNSLSSLPDHFKWSSGDYHKSHKTKQDKKMSSPRHVLGIRDRSMIFDDECDLDVIVEGSDTTIRDDVDQIFRRR